jgi:hypothetical protein
MAAAPDEQARSSTESVKEALCRLIDGAAQKHRLPTAFLTRLIWRESSFRSHVVSPVGAQGVAQFMPGTANERGLADPFDPEQAIPHAAHLLSDLRAQFGNFGLAAAAYNGGPSRVAKWIAGAGGLPQETRDYVAYITGRTAVDWATDPKSEPTQAAASESQTCLQVTALLKVPGQMVPEAGQMVPEAPIAPWGVQLAGQFSKAQALATYSRASRSYASLIAETRPMIIGTRLRSRGTRAFYRGRVPQPTRATALKLCDKIRAVGGACVVLPS